jgi:hypothetical protein
MAFFVYTMGKITPDLHPLAVVFVDDLATNLYFYVINCIKSLECHL